MNALEKVTDLLVAVVIMFLLTLLYYGSGTRMLRVITVGQTGENFLKRVSTAGEITLPVWNELETALSNSGCTDYEIQRERKLYKLMEETGKVTEQTYIANRKELREEIVSEGKSRLQQGDRLWLKLYVNDVPMIYCESVRTGGIDS